MSIGVVLLVLFAALLHASWNALVKSSPDKFLDIVLVTSGSAVFCVAALPFLALPMPASWPYVAASVVIHIVYFALIGAAYRCGDMSHAYPLMRGVPPLLVALLSGPLIGEQLSAGEWGGILLICGGILGLLLVGKRSGGMSRASTGFALVNAVAIAGYTLVDGTGVRLSAHPVAYTMCGFFCWTAPPILAWALLRRRAGGRRPCSRCVGTLALIGGAFTLGAYILVLWAMTQAPIAMVAALRETAIVFATGLSVVVLKERFGWGRPAAAAIILLGVIAIKLA